MNLRLKSRLILFGVFLVLFISSTSHAATLKATIDPSELAAGARPLGLGRAYVAAADDAYAIFQNPAGLSRIEQLQVTSMYSKLIEEVDYNLLGLAHPLSREAIGASFVRASVGGSLLSQRDPVTDRIVPVGGAIGYNSAVAFLTYAVSADKYLSYPYLKNVHLGASFKIFSQELTGVPASDVTALGYDLDIGAQYQPYSYLTLGFAGYNVLPYSLGGRLIWGSGISESIPASAKLGAQLKLLGKGGLREYRFLGQELFLNFDHEMAVASLRPGLNHLGLEWLLNDWLALRGGFDQDAVALGGGAVGVQTNLAAGLGITAFNFRFDYAFHTFGELAENNTHFFSISYGMEKKKPPPPPPPIITEYLTLESPADKTVTFDPYIILKGRVLFPDKVKNLLVNDGPANLYPDGSFFSIVRLKDFGRNPLEIRVIGITGRIVETKVLTTVRLTSFKDIPANHPQRMTIGGLATLKYITGFRDGTFRPAYFMPRGDLLKILTRTGQSPLIIKGYKPGLLRMEQPLTRAEAVELLSKFASLPELKALYEKPYQDVALRHWASRSIMAAKRAGWLDFVKGNRFFPDKKITRREMVMLLSQIKFFKEKLNELLDG